MRSWPRHVLAILLPLFSSGAAAQVDAPEATDATLEVVVKAAPPFVIFGDEGATTGIAIELWEQIARQLGVSTDYQRADLPTMLARVAAGEADLAVGAISVTAQRERDMDFTHPFFTSGLGIVTTEAQGRDWSSIIASAFSWRFIQAIAALALLLLVVGVLVWLVERRRNEDFGGGPLRGLGSGFWFSAVTMTTVGYGDKAPRTPGGRLISLVWMFASIIIISSFTAAIASALTASHLTTGIEGEGDLAGKSVAAVEGSTSADYLRQRGIRRRLVADVASGLEAVRSGDADALVHDRPILQYQMAVGRQGRGLTLLETSFAEQPYALALRPGSDRLEAVNRALLDVLESAEWGRTVAQYLEEGELGD